MKNSYGLSADFGRNGLLDFSVINTHIIFKGVYLGCTTANTQLAKEMDSIDITYQQKGSKPQDKIITGMELKLTTSLALARESVMALLDGVVCKEDTGDSYLTTHLFTSLLHAKGGPLLLAKSNADGTISERSEDHLWLYEAIPMVKGNVVMGGMEQQSKEVEFTIILKDLHGYQGHKGDIKAAFGYFGDDPKNLPKVMWPVVPTVSHNGYNITLNYNSAIEQQGSLAYRISQQHKGRTINYDATGVIIENSIVLTPQSEDDEKPTLNKLGGVVLFGNEGQVVHANGSPSAMLPEILVPYMKDDEVESDD